MEWIYRRAMQKRRTANLAKREGAAPCPILSVGNLSTGGTGKTPAVQWLARTVQSWGRKVGVVTSGYGGTLSETGGLVSNGSNIFLTAREAGDEAVLHARNLAGAIVAMGKDRHAATQIAVKNGAEVVILDDGFQFWSLPRAFDLVLLDARQLFGNGHLLPWGRLREEPQALQRADAIVLTRSDRATPQELETTRQSVKNWTSAPTFLAQHAPHDWRDEKSGAIQPLHWVKGQTVKAFAGLADNEQFYDSLHQLGAAQIMRLKRERGDHHHWAPKDFRWLEAAQDNAYQNQLFETLPAVTTEKDAVKLDTAWFSGPLFSLRIGLQIENETALQNLIFEKLESLKAP